MVIANCLRSPQQSSVEMAASAGTTLSQLFSLIGMEFKFNNLRAIFGRRHKLPFLHGVLACLNEQGLSPDDPRAFYTTVRRDDGFHFDFASNVLSSCKLVILRGRIVRVIAFAFVHYASLRTTHSASYN